VRRRDVQHAAGFGWIQLVRCAREPIAPWATLAAIPTILVAVGGVLAIRRGRAYLLMVFLGSVYLLALLVALAFTASF
jgi:hypothetical protein